MPPQKSPPIPEIANSVINENRLEFGKPKDTPNNGNINVRNDIGNKIPKLTPLSLIKIGGMNITAPNRIIAIGRDENATSPSNIKKIINNPRISPFIPPKIIGFLKSELSTTSPVGITYYIILKKYSSLLLNLTF